MKIRLTYKIMMAWLAVTLGLCLVVTSGVLAQQEKWHELDQQAVKLYRQGKSAEAIPVSQRALQLAEKTCGPNHANVAKALDYLALLYRKTGRAEDASKFEERAKEIKSRSQSR